MIDVGDWQIATNPPPAVGGASLAAMLQCFGTEKFARWDEASIRRLIDTQQAVLSFRGARIDSAQMVNALIAELLKTVRTDTFLSTWASGSTVHTSAVNGDHLACAITASSGYGSGDMPNGTGLWLNNCLGELELNQFGLAATPPGKTIALEHGTKRRAIDGGRTRDRIARRRPNYHCAPSVLRQIRATWS